MLHPANMRLTHPAVALSAAWLNNSISYYLDGRLYHTVHSSAVLLPTAPMHVIFDQVWAGGENLFSAWPQLLTHPFPSLHQAVDPLLVPPHGGDDAAYKGDGVSMRVAWVRAYTLPA